MIVTVGATPSALGLAVDVMGVAAAHGRVRRAHLGLEAAQEAITPQYAGAG